VRTADRARLQRGLASAGIETLVHYPVALHDQPAFAPFHPAACPEASRAAEALLSLPLHPRMQDADVITVAEALAGILKGRVPA